MYKVVTLMQFILVHIDNNFNWFLNLKKKKSNSEYMCPAIIIIIGTLLWYAPSHIVVM